LEGLDPKYQALLSRFQPIDDLYPKPITKKDEGFIYSVGKASSTFFKDVKQFIEFVGKVTAGFFRFCVNRKNYAGII
jgi:hypothetical protein